LPSIPAGTAEEAFVTSVDARTVRVAAIQAAPVVLDAEASVQKAVALIGEAAGQGAELVVFAECFVSLYPDVVTLREALQPEDRLGRLYDLMWHEAMEVPGPLVDELVSACAEHGVTCVIGVNEREPGRSSSLYNTMLTLGPRGVLARHRKLMPTHHERLIHSFGAGDDLGVIETPVGRIGGLICWENRMPLARYAVYRGSPHIYVAPTADGGRPFQSLMKAIAVESGAYVVSVVQYQPAAAYPSSFPLSVPPDEELPYVHGGTCIVDAEGEEFLAGPLYGEEGILVADLDLGRLVRGKRAFDVTGHYSREEVLLPLLVGDGARSVALLPSRP
jgi:nitrilase